MTSVLKLVVSKKPFEVMQTGEKLEEFRNMSKWMTSRLYNKDASEKHYDLLQITWGYGKDRPSFTAKYNGFVIESDISRKYSNGLKIDINGTPTYVLNLSFDST